MNKLDTESDYTLCYRYIKLQLRNCIKEAWAALYILGGMSTMQTWSSGDCLISRGNAINPLTPTLTYMPKSHPSGINNSSKYESGRHCWWSDSKGLRFKCVVHYFLLLFHYHNPCPEYLNWTSCLSSQAADQWIKQWPHTRVYCEWPQDHWPPVQETCQWPCPPHTAPTHIAKFVVCKQCFFLFFHILEM